MFDLRELTRETEQLREEAKQQAQEIMQRAKVESQKLIDSATDLGFAEGKNKGLAEGRAEGHQTGREEAIAQFTPQLQELQTAFIAVVERWEVDLNSMLLAAREDVLRFALAAVEKITHRVTCLLVHRAWLPPEPLIWKRTEGRGSPPLEFLQCLTPLLVYPKPIHGI